MAVPAPKQAVFNLVFAYADFWHRAVGRRGWEVPPFTFEDVSCCVCVSKEFFHLPLFLFQSAVYRRYYCVSDDADGDEKLKTCVENAYD